jgi:hypothetical protein
MLRFLMSEVNPDKKGSSSVLSRMQEIIWLKQSERQRRPVDDTHRPTTHRLGQWVVLLS